MRRPEDSTERDRRSRSAGRGASAPLHAPPRAPRALPFVGHAPEFLIDKLGFLLRCAGQADVVELRLGRRRTFLLSDPEDIRHVLVTEHHSFTKNERLLNPVDPELFGDALVGVSKERHMHKRRALQPVYQQHHLAGFGEVVERCVEELVERWTGQPDVDIVSESVKLAQRIRIRVLLGPGTAAETELPAALEARQRYIAQAFLSPLPHAGRRPSKARRDYRQARRLLEHILVTEIERRRRTETRGGDLLSLLVGTPSEHGAAPTDRTAAAEATTFLASYEMSGQALAWTLHLLAEHPEVQARLLPDAERSGDARACAATEPSANVLLGYPQMVCSEALRLYPPSWLFVRIALDQVTLPSGPVIPRGARLMLSPYSSHRDAQRFPDPDRFDPERFRAGPALRARPRYAYFPFGGGPHVCIGEGFVRMEVALTITRLARAFELTSVPGRRVTPSPRVTLELRGAPRARLSPRSTLSTAGDPQAASCARLPGSP